MKKRTTLALLATLCLGFIAHPGAQAAERPYPQKPVTLVVPWNPGGSADLTGRKLSEILSRQGVTLVIENLPGASSTIGLSKVARAEPDGYTIGLVTSSLMGAIAQGITKLKVDDFTALNLTTIEQLILVVPQSSPVNNVADLIKAMKEKPGGISIGTPGSNNVNHTFAASLARATGTEFVHVPYTGGAKVLIDLGGNQIDAGVLKPSETSSQIEAKLIKPIGVFSNDRVDVMPDVQTFAENQVDVFPFGALEQMSYLVAPKGVDPELAKKMKDMLAKAIASDEYQAFAKQNAMRVIDVRGDKLQAQAIEIQKSFDVVAPKIFIK